MARTPDTHATSIRGLARQVGRSESTVRKWIKRPDWPFGPRAPWVVDKVQGWMALYLGRDPAARYHAAQKGLGPKPLSELEAARTANQLEAAAIRRLHREETEGLLHNVEECRRRRLRQIHAVKGALRGLPRSIGPELVGLSRPKIERLLRERLRGILEGFAGE